jgi:hypothetical protein
MYYKESLHLIDQSPLDKDALKKLDRELAHAYAPGGYGYAELSLLCNNTRLAETVVRTLLGRYVSAGVINSYVQVSCPCGATYDPSEEACMDCGRPVADASPNGITCYCISMQPTAPAYNPHAQSVAPKVFISYCHADCLVLAADIYYSLLAEGQSVFLDDGSIAVGAASEQTYLNAASNAEYFIALVSTNYFQSDFCKREIAHAARRRRRLIRVNIPPVPPAPSDMPWIDGPNWNKQQGSANGLEHALEESLLSALEIQSSAATIADLRKEACQFLMEQLSPGEVEGLWNRLPWMTENFSPGNAKHQNIGLILRETTGQRLPTLCSALAP